MKIQTSLLVGLTVACLWPSAHAAESPKLAQIKTLVSGYRQKSFGPFAHFAGVYDILKSCRPSERDIGLGTEWLLAKSLIWFEGDNIIVVSFLTPAKVERGTLKFKQDYAMSRDLTIKLYDVNLAGGTDIMAFLPDRDLFGGKFDGRKYDFYYAMRCANEDQIIESAEEILRLIGQ